MVSKFNDNGFLAGLESLILQFMPTNSESHFAIIANHPPKEKEPHLYDKLVDLLDVLEVEYVTSRGLRNTIAPGQKRKVQYDIELNDFKVNNAEEAR